MLRLALAWPVAVLLALALAGCGAMAAAGNNAAAPWRGPTAAPATPAPSRVPPPGPIVLGGPADVSLGGDDSAGEGAGISVPADTLPGDSGPLSPTAQPAGTIALRLGEMTERGSLRLRFVGVIEDSRCPDGATCVWAGRVVVAVEVDDGSGAPAEMTLGLPGLTPDAPDSQTVAGQQLEFVDLAPYPAIGAEPADDAYVLTLQLQP